MNTLSTITPTTVRSAIKQIDALENYRVIHQGGSTYEVSEWFEDRDYYLSIFKFSNLRELRMHLAYYNRGGSENMSWDEFTHAVSNGYIKIQ